MVNCIFCKIAKGEILASKVYESDKFIAFLDISPCNKGHTLIIPKEHYERIEEMPSDEGEEFGKLQVMLTKAIMKVTKADGCNLLLNNGKAAGQEVMHTHMHIQPRFNTDQFHYKWAHIKYDGAEMERYRENIEKAL